MIVQALAPTGRSGTERTQQQSKVLRSRFYVLGSTFSVRGSAFYVRWASLLWSREGRPSPMSPVTATSTSRHRIGCESCKRLPQRYLTMPERQTIKRARRDARDGKAPSTQAGEFVREEIDHIREGKHGARSAKQAIAIGLSKARRAGVKLPPPKSGRASAGTRKQAARDVKRGRAASSTSRSAKRSKAATRALKKEGRAAVSHRALSQQAKRSARQRTATARSQQAVRAAATRKRKKAR